MRVADMVRRVPLWLLVTGAYLLALLMWLLSGTTATAQPPELLVAGGWLALPSQPEARRLVLYELAASDYRVPHALPADRFKGDADDDVAATELSGWVLDLELMLPLVEQALPGARIYPFYRRVEPERTATDFEHLSQIIGAWYCGSGGTGSRAVNVRLASAAIDGRIVWPGEEFSFNEATGPTTLERGYENAIVIVHDAFVQGPGGGVCQVSSTLHCALQEAGLKIVERHRHSLPVGYVPQDRDATVSYGSLDLRFENDTGWPVLIQASSDGYSVWVQILTMDWKY